MFFNNKIYYIHRNLLEKIDDEEELTRKCLFENADAFETFDEPILSFKNNSYIKTIKSKDLKEREETKMKEIKNQKVVDLYFKRKEEALADEFEVTDKAIVDTDKNQIFIQGIKQQLDTYIEDNDIEAEVVYPILPFTKETEEKRLETYNDYKKKLDELNNLKEEILAMLYGCETYEQEMEILHTYKIVNYNSHYVSMNKIDVNDSNKTN